MGANRIEEIRFYASEHPRRFEMIINDTSLSYLSLEEALNLRDEIQVAIQKSISLPH